MGLESLEYDLEGLVGLLQKRLKPQTREEKEKAIWEKAKADMIAWHDRGYHGCVNVEVAIKMSIDDILPNLATALILMYEEEDGEDTADGYLIQEKYREYLMEVIADFYNEFEPVNVFGEKQ